MGDFKIHHGDCVEVMRGMADASVDSIVCDPPYGLEFMGKEWDAPWKQAGVAGGKVSGLGDADGTPFRRNAGTPAFGASGNPLCVNCGGSKYDRKNKCECDAPRFPNHASIQMRAFQAWCETWAVEALRVLKPGGHLLAFSGSRTYHRMVCAIEDAGFEIRDQIMWLYGSGVPKSLDVSKAIDKAAGAEREVTGPNRWAARVPDGTVGLRGNEFSKPPETDPATDAARQWSGWGTALKPAHEPIVVARKPLIGTVSANVQAHGTGALNIDACRVGLGEGRSGGTDGKKASGTDALGGSWSGGVPKPTGARWPANVIHDGSDEVVGAFPDTTSGKPSGIKAGNNNNVFGQFAGGIPVTGFGDTGSAARFFKSCPPDATDEAWHHLEKSARSASVAANLSAPCETPIAGDPAGARTSASKSGASPAIPASTGSSGNSIQPLNPADAALQGDTDTTRITQGRSTSFGYASPVTAESINPASAGPAVADSAPVKATRFLYCAKASKADRDAGLEGMPEVRSSELTGRSEGSIGLVGDPDNKGQTANPFAGSSGEVRRNVHPTVKPTALMRYLCRLVTPPGGLVLDPFTGSGSTGRGAILEGFRFVGIEQDETYCGIAHERIRNAVVERWESQRANDDAPADLFQVQA